jgi:hypothetical protein
MASSLQQNNSVRMFVKYYSDHNVSNIKRAENKLENMS